MRAGESRTVIKRMQEFMDNLDRHVLKPKSVGKYQSEASGRGFSGL